MIRFVLFCLLIGLVGGIWFSYLRPVSMGGTAAYVVVNGPSMQPTLRNGDFAFLQKQSTYTLGDIVAVRVGGSYAIHRIVGFEGPSYITKGDNRTAPDTWRPTKSEIAGKMVAHLPGAGRLLQGKLLPLVLGPVLGLLATIIVFGGKPVLGVSVRRQTATQELADDDALTGASDIGWWVPPEDESQAA